MSEELEKAQDGLLGKLNQLCAKFGLNNIMAQLYTILYLQNKPMSLDEMVERLKISKGSVSTNIRSLERYGAVRKVWIKGCYWHPPYSAKVLRYSHSLRYMGR